MNAGHGHEAATRDWRNLAKAGWSALGWGLLAVLSWLVVSRQLSLTFPAKFTVLLQGLTPLVFLPVYLVLITSVFGRRRMQGVACLALIAYHLAAIHPALGTREVPAWAESAQTIRVLSSNVFDNNPEPVAAVEYLLSQNADVLMLSEVTAPMDDALQAAGIEDRYPFQQTGDLTAGNSNVEAIYSRYPLTDAAEVMIGNQGFPGATVTVGSVRLRLLAAHIEDPLGNRVEWKQELMALEPIIRGARLPMVIGGDLNSTRWHPHFGDLLGMGLNDASESRGQGLTFSWPMQRLLPFPVMRLDHQLGSAGAEPLAVGNLSVPGSDHRGVLVNWAVKGL